MAEKRDAPTTDTAAGDVRATGDGRTRLLDAAERLIDERGIDGCSARAIAVAAGHRNVAAVNYHFRNRDQLVLAVLTRRSEAIDAERQALLDALEAAGPVTPRAAIEAVVAPLVRLLEDPAGRRHIRLLNQAANHPSYYGSANQRYNAGTARGAAHVAPLLAHLPPEQRPHRAQLVIGIGLYTLALQARLLDTDPPPRPVLDDETFARDLVDVLHAALSA